MAYLDTKKLRRKFAAAAQTYDDAAVLQREVADRMLERLQFVKQVPETILDVGCGTGFCVAELNKIYPEAFVAGFDVALPMLTQAKSVNDQPNISPGYFAADAHLIPVKNKSVDLIVSNLMLQWCDQQAVFNEFARILKPGGLVMFTTFGPDTLNELRAAWEQVDSFPHVHDFTDMHNIGDDLLHCRLAEPVMDKETITLTYENVTSMMEDLRNIGANNAVKKQFTGLTGKNRFNRFKQAYENMRVEGRIPASYEIIYGQAWGSENPVTSESSHKKIIPVRVQRKPR
jgi:malonyl-CoA O-methyltransferase